MDTANLSTVNGTVRDIGIVSYAWPQAVASFASTTNATTYSFGFIASEIYSSKGVAYRWHGLPLRCLSTALEG